MANAIREYFPEEITWVEPRGGFYVWLKLPPKLDIMSVLKTSIEKGAVFVIWKTFDPAGKDNSHFRLAYSHTSEDKIEKGIQILGECLKEELRLSNWLASIKEFQKSIIKCQITNKYQIQMLNDLRNKIFIFEFWDLQFKVFL